MGMLCGKSKKSQGMETEYDEFILVRWKFCYYGVIFVQ
jgi:hypothetical protein